MHTTRTLILLVLLLGLAACSEAALPTPIPTAAPPVPASPTADESEALPATRDLSTATPQPQPTSQEPTRPATRTPTPVIAPILSIGSPAPGARLPLGGEVEVSGFTYSVPGMILQLGLTSHTGWAIATATELERVLARHAADTANVYGSAELIWRRCCSTIHLQLAEPRPESYLTLIRPQPDLIAAAGHALYFDGNLRSDTGGRMHVAVLMNDCQEEVTDYSFMLNGSTFWQVYVILPENVEGPACAVVTKDEPGSEGWMAAQVPLTIYPRDDERGQSIAFAHPSAGQRFTGGQTINVNGVAYNAPNGEVHINVTTEDGRVLADTTVEADRNGFWLLELSLPPDADGLIQVQVQASLGDPLSPSATAQLIFNPRPHNSRRYLIVESPLCRKISQQCPGVALFPECAG